MILKNKMNDYSLSFYWLVGLESHFIILCPQILEDISNFNDDYMSGNIMAGAT